MAAIYPIELHKSAGPLELGMTREQISGVMGSEPQTFKKTVNSTSECDHFEDVGIVVSYDDSDNAQAIEFLGPAMPTYKNVELLRMSEGEVNSWINDEDPGATINDDDVNMDVVSTKLGIALWLHPPELGVKSVLVFIEGYYD